MFLLFFSIFGLVANFGYKVVLKRKLLYVIFDEWSSNFSKKDTLDLMQEDLDQIVENINNGTYYLEEKPNIVRIHVSSPIIGFPK